MENAQTPGHLFGPAKPAIGFWYGERFLGEALGHPSDVQAAQAKLLASLEMLSTGDPAARTQLLRYTQAKVYCSQIAREIPTSRPDAKR